MAAIADATTADAPLVWDAAPGNVAAEARHGDAAAADEAFARAAQVVALDLVNQRLAPTPLEPRAVLACTEGERVILRLSSQMPGGVRATLCNEVFGWPLDKLRVRVGDVGGGFGMKTGAYPEDIVVAWCADRLKRPVKWTAERSEEFVGAGHGRDLVSRAELALDGGGRVLALRVRSQANVGAYATSTGVLIQLLVGPWVATSVYDIPVSTCGCGGADPHHAHRRLRAPAWRGDLRDRAADGRRRAPARAGRARAAPAQPDPPRADALPQPDGAGLRQRPVREGAGGGSTGAGRLGRASTHAPPNRRSAAGCAAAASPPSSNGPAATPSRSG